MQKPAPRLALTLLLMSSLVILSYHYFEPQGQFIVGGALESTLISDGDFPKTVTDPTGQTYIMHAPAKRIVSVILAGDEMLQQLNAIDEVISVTHLVDDEKFSNIVGYYPESIPRNHAGLEETLSLEPDLVIAASYTDAVTIRLLLANNIPVVRFGLHHSFRDIDNNIRTLAKAIDRSAQADIVLNDMWRRINYVQCLHQQNAKSPISQEKPKTLYYALNGATAGKKTLLGEMIHYAGGHNVIEDTDITGHTHITVEYAVSLQPEVLIVTDWFAVDASEALEKLQKHPLWRDVPAVINKRVYVIRTNISGTVTPYRVLGIEELAKVFNPDLYQASNVKRCQHFAQQIPQALNN